MSEMKMKIRLKLRTIKYEESWFHKFLRLEFRLLMVRILICNQLFLIRLSNPEFRTE